MAGTPRHDPQQDPVHRVVALVRPPQSVFELGCAAEVFGTRRPGLPARYDFGVCTPRPGPVPTTAGYDMVVTRGLSALETADTVVIPGWTPAGEPLAPAARTALRRAHARGARLVSICSGAFALAQTGLLDGRRATTHWNLAATLTERFPRIEVDPAVLYVDHGDLATSAGAAAGVDLCLHLVRRDHGAAHAARIARHMVMPPHREGGQAQYAAPPPGEGAGPAPGMRHSLAPLLEWVAGRLAEPMSVEDMAGRLRISPRTLARRFADQLGTSPGQWLLDRRLAAARALLEESDLPVEAVALRVGLSSAVNFRRRFQHALHTTPSAYRRAFRAAGGAPRAGDDA
ncbi:helix-turn-helix domain-containing protein [Streptomyces sp. DSM 41527]|uniref:Helix-turn-helix domain-containing protein n=1 Tax=Streptomyces mooreae TaxID=3075523 RepID=A0ABU2T2Z2_9ACTN|nr:helix-turn-helix domain-containing protein [Streptomyces sp. DSM 41527]MDT0455373.1 helix-turn-helix domain-containing protein [Streptomyces sp. DSM 41527]